MWRLRGLLDPPGAVTLSSRVPGFAPGAIVNLTVSSVSLFTVAFPILTPSPVTCTFAFEAKPAPVRVSSVLAPARKLDGVIQSNWEGE